MNEHNQLKKLPNTTDHNCVGCSPKNTKGLRLEFYTDGVKVYTSVKVPIHMCGWENMVHGGIISTILDEIMSWTAIHTLKKFILTKSMTVDFQKPVFVGEELRAEGIVIEQSGPREAVVQGSLFNAEGKLCAVSKGTFALVKPELLKKMGVLDDAGVEVYNKLLEG